MNTLEFRNGGLETQAAVYPAPTGDHLYYEGCEAYKLHDMGETALESNGRMLDVTLTLKRVCPCRRVAVGLVLSEVDEAGNEYPRGFKAITVPAHYQSGRCDVTMAAQRFIMPEDLRTDTEDASTCWSNRHFVIRATSHYIDTAAPME